MTRKRFIKLLMGKCIDKKSAQLFACIWLWAWGSYENAWKHIWRHEMAMMLCGCRDATSRNAECARQSNSLLALYLLRTHISLTEWPRYIQDLKKGGLFHV